MGNNGSNLIFLVHKDAAGRVRAETLPMVSSPYYPRDLRVSVEVDSLEVTFDKVKHPDGEKERQFHRYSIILEPVL